MPSKAMQSKVYIVRAHLKASSPPSSTRRTPYRPSRRLLRSTRRIKERHARRSRCPRRILIQLQRRRHTVRIGLQPHLLHHRIHMLLLLNRSEHHRVPRWQRRRRGRRGRRRDRRTRLLAIKGNGVIGHRRHGVEGKRSLSWRIRYHHRLRMWHGVDRRRR